VPCRACVCVYQDSRRGVCGAFGQGPRAFCESRDSPRSLGSHGELAQWTLRVVESYYVGDRDECWGGCMDVEEGWGGVGWISSGSGLELRGFFTEGTGLVENCVGFGSGVEW